MPKYISAGDRKLEPFLKEEDGTFHPLGNFADAHTFVVGELFVKLFQRAAYLARRGGSSEKDVAKLLKVLVPGVPMYTAEHLFQFLKCCLTGDADHVRKILETPSPRRAKLLGGPKKCALTEQQLVVWHKERISAMRLVLRIKFLSNPDLAKKLRESTGKNHLGELLMELRKELQTMDTPAWPTWDSYSPASTLLAKLAAGVPAKQLQEVLTSYVGGALRLACVTGCPLACDWTHERCSILLGLAEAQRPGVFAKCFMKALVPFVGIRSLDYYFFQTLFTTGVADVTQWRLPTSRYDPAMPAINVHSKSADPRGRTLSTMYQQPVQGYPTPEAFFHARKLDHVRIPPKSERKDGEHERCKAGTETLRGTLAKCLNARQAKSLGGKKSFATHGIVLDTASWEAARVGVQEEIIAERLESEHFRKTLRSTGDALLLHSDRSGPKSFWGGGWHRAKMVLFEDGRFVLRGYSVWRGGNVLGELLRDARDELRESEA